MNNINSLNMNITVEKVNGSFEPYDIKKIRNEIAAACEGKNVDPLELESTFHSALPEKVTASYIQEQLIISALDLCSIDSPDWKYVAGRLKVNLLYHQVVKGRGFGYGDFYRTVQHYVSTNQWQAQILTKYSKEELEKAGSWIVKERDNDFDHAGIHTLSDKTLRNFELPQEVFLVTALLLALPEEKNNRLSFAKDLYEAISLRKLSLATPLLSNSRKPSGAAASCYIIQPQDDLESIFHEITNAAKISKNGGGVGVCLSNIRAAGAEIAGRANSSNGVIPWAVLFNYTGVAVDQGGTRAGAITVALDTWHYDFMEFLDIQTEHGEQRKKAYDIFLQAIVSNLFMERVKADLDWYLVDPHEVKKIVGVDLANTWGEEFNKAYAKVEEAIQDNKIFIFKRLKARYIFKEILKRYVETGMPYLAFKDHINAANPNKKLGNIPCVNLCVAPETKILTTKGQLIISSLENQEVEVWNGSEFSKVTVKKTGENQPLLKVNFSNGETLECTPYHKFYIQRTRLNRPTSVDVIEAKDLKHGDKLIKYDLPIIQTVDAVDFPYAYTSGFYSGDGSITKQGVPEIDLYQNKRSLLPHLEIRNLLRGDTDELAVYDDVRQNRIVCKLPSDIPAKFTVPLNGYTIKSKLEWFAGLLDSDGTVARNGLNESLQVASVNKEFLLEVRLMLQTLGIDSKVTLNRKEGIYPLPDSKGGLKDYKCKEVNRLLVSSNDLYKLKELGLVTHRLQWKGVKPQRNASQFITVETVEDNGRISDTFCFNEPLQHKGMFNGLLTGQCVESFSTVVPYLYSHVCQLLSLNLANLTFDELQDIVALGVRTLDNGLTISSVPFKEGAAHVEAFRTIGLGALGLADWLAIRKLRYTDLDEIEKLFEHIAYYSALESIKLAKERAPFDTYNESEWAKGILFGKKDKAWFENNKTFISTEDWLKVFDLVEEYGIRNSILNCIAPNTSTSLVQGATASILPVFSRYYIDKGKAALIQTPPYLSTHRWFYQENKHLRQEVIVDAVAVMQKWIDTGISMELVFNLNEYAYGDEEALTAKGIYDVVIKAWEKECKAIYYIRTIRKDIESAKTECSSCAN